jgi:putative peptide zinc metalloprotease protein
MSLAARTFDESWHRVEIRRVRLLPGVRMSRQSFRGEIWHVLRDPLGNRFFRVRPAAWKFLCLLEHAPDVGSAWRTALERDPDGAPGQGEIVQLLGQLYRAGLLASDLEGDVAALFESRREEDENFARQQWASLLFLRIPLFNPDPFLRRTLPFVSWLISPLGLLLWLSVVVWGLRELADQWPRFQDSAQSLLGAANLPWLYAALIGTKAIHELGHAYTCRKYGGEVPLVGLILLVLNPLPFVDASSSWQFRDKWKRVLVASAGMLVEFFIAAIAIVIWSRTGDGILNRVAFNTIVIASVSTLLFNINPLLRFDGYHILCDVLEVPNLQSRAQHMVRWLIDRHVFRIPPGPSPVASTGQAVGFTLFHIASLIYRFFLLAGILLFISTQWMIVGIILAIVFAILWILVPVVKSAHHLLTSPKLAPVRGRAVLVGFGSVALVIGFLALVPLPNHFRADGIVSATPYVQVHAGADGRLASLEVPSGRQVGKGEILLRLANPDLQEERRLAAAQYETARVRLRESRVDDPARYRSVEKLVVALEDRLRALDEEIERLVVRAPDSGRWLAPELAESQGQILLKGQMLGAIQGLGQHRFIAVVSQGDVARIFSGNVRKNEVKILGQEAQTVTLANVDALPAERERLPSAALGMMGGGGIGVEAKDGGTETTEPVFELRGDFPGNAAVVLNHGQRGVIRFSLPWEPLLSQWERSLRQLFQRRYRI